MKCISIMQPYAWCVSTGIKTLETRTWKTAYRGPLLIAASKKIDQGHYKYLQYIGIKLPPKKDLEYGKIIATTNLTSCVIFTRAMEKFSLCTFYHGYGFWLKGTKMLKNPVPVRGALGLYEVPWP